MIDERRFSRKEKIDLENDYQICSSSNWVSDVFPPISAPSVFTLLFVLPRRAFFPCLPLIDSIHTLSVIVIGRFQKWYGELIIKIESGWLKLLESYPSLPPTIWTRDDNVPWKRYVSQLAPPKISPWTKDLRTVLPFQRGRKNRRLASVPLSNASANAPSREHLHFLHTHASEWIVSCLCFAEYLGKKSVWYLVPNPENRLVRGGMERALNRRREHAAG